MVANDEQYEETFATLTYNEGLTVFLKAIHARKYGTIKYQELTT